MTNEKALNEFIEVIGVINSHLEDLRGHLGDHLGVSPDDVCWGDVSEARYVLAQITQINNFVFGREE